LQLRFFQLQVLSRLRFIRLQVKSRLNFFPVTGRVAIKIFQVKSQVATRWDRLLIWDYSVGVKAYNSIQNFEVAPPSQTRLPHMSILELE
jgi:hypothetical protein